MTRRLSYKHALRAKGIRPIPKYAKLRSSYAGGEVIDATRPTPRAPRRAVLHLDNGIDVPLVESRGPLRYERMK
jgi:hypothetical protein